MEKCKDSRNPFDRRKLIEWISSYFTYFSKTDSLLEIEDSLNKLKIDEVEILFWLVLGYRSGEISKKMGLSNSRISQHIQMIRKKIAEHFGISVDWSSVKWNKINPVKLRKYIQQNDHSVVDMVCWNCGKYFNIHSRRLKDGNHGRFCSYKCRSVYNYKYIKKRDTSIEIAIEKQFIYHSIQYEKQVPIKNIGVVDFLVNNDIIVQCDGSYWHGSEKSKKRDKIQDNLYVKYGFTVYRLMEKNIKKDPERAILHIITEIKNR